MNSTGSIQYTYCDHTDGIFRHVLILTIVCTVVPPSWVLEPTDLSVPVGGRVELPCAAGGHPTPTVTWKRNTGLAQHTRHTLDVSHLGCYLILSLFFLPDRFLIPTVGFLILIKFIVGTERLSGQL